MGLPVKYDSVSALYPIRRDDYALALMQALLTGERRDGKPVIKRVLTSDEKAALTTRKKVLAEALQPGSYSEVKAIVVQMLLGFNKTASRDEAAAIASQYIKVLQSLPLWAIKRACAKFERGEVVDGIDGVAKMIVDSKGPTTAQLYPVAKAMVDTWYLELTNIHNCLTGVVQQDISPEVQERVKAGLEELAEGMKQRFFEHSKRSSAQPFMTDEELLARYPPNPDLTKKKRTSGRKVA